MSSQRRLCQPGSLLPGKIAEGLPVMALNVNHVDVNFFRVKPGSLASFVSQWEYRSSLSNWSPTIC
ncbi:lipoprotein [Salmonella enterica subsp. enterica]|nr:lipoprotein [Salmonella enterica subsp. enterica]